jgi:hypothetical protein
MKNFKHVLKIALSLSLALTSVNALAIDPPGGPSGTKSSPLSVNLFKPIISRLNTISLDYVFNQMQNEGLTQKGYVAGFTAKGALAYLHELNGAKIWEPKTAAGRNVGGQVLPFTISMTEDGKKYISAAAFGLRNMNTAYGTDAFYRQGFYEAYQVVDRLDFGVFSLDENYHIEGLTETKFDFVQAEAKINLLGDSKNKSGETYLALTGEAAPLGLHTTKITMLTNDSAVLESAGSSLSFTTALGYGLEFNKGTQTGWRINAGAKIKQSWSNGAKFVSPETAKRYADDLQSHNASMDAYQIASDNYAADKLAYEAQYLNGVAISEQSYASLTGATKPGKPGDAPDEPEGDVRANRATMLFAPSIEISKQVNKKNYVTGVTKNPVRLGFSLQGALPVFDRATTSKGEIDLSKMNRQIVNGKLFLSF